MLAHCGECDTRRRRRIRILVCMHNNLDFNCHRHQRGFEAVAAFMEDVCTFHELRTSHARFKWARAIVASVASDKSCSDILHVPYEHELSWECAIALVQAATSGGQLSARIFDGAYSHIVRYVMSTVIPQFYHSREYAVYLSAIACVRRSVLEVVPRVVPAQDHAELLRQAANRPLSANDFIRMGCIGQGSYGSVFVWKHVLTGVCYAVKVYWCHFIIMN